MNILAKIKAFGRFWYDFIVGDDWRVALGVAAALATTWELTYAHVTAWWLPCLAVAGLLALSLARVVRTARPAPDRP